MTVVETDILVIGSGVSGLYYAIKSHKLGRLMIINKLEKYESATYYAQGGIASVFSSEDSFEEHISDTLVAGDGLCNRDAVEVVVRDAPNRIKELIGLGVKFSKAPDPVDNDVVYDLTREGGHTKRRILHADDLTGREIEVSLMRAAENMGVRVSDHRMAIDLITINKVLGIKGGQDRVIGAYVLNTLTGDVETVLAKLVILATGGAGKVYLYTSNPDTETGDGIAMAYRAGASIANMEFIQFHPTCLYHPEAKSFLISESVRGEGGILKRKDGTPFMAAYHPMKELAPRDIVARAIDSELKKSGDEYVLLDVTHLDPDFTRKRFPHIYNTLLKYGIDMTGQPIPVVPAAHYTCGGVVADLDGRTDIRGLFAIGETACTGLHGANRLASNSLIEGLVFANRVAQTTEPYLGDKLPYETIPPWTPGNAVDSDEMVVVSHNWDEIRRLMWNYVGIVRSDKRLVRARRRIEMIREEINEYYWHFKVNKDVLELRNIATVAELAIRCAQIRRESRGIHYNIDYPHKDDAAWLKDTVIKKQ
ncbi:MAG: L-aspartate oxidase [Deltaproteobacteria bacterium]|nr:L-aspartate oxidase [Deltaproteobacteria bacterium]MCL5277282.1 L-aspartate oxidase [Deltaproteobacteria bacterium]